MKEIYREYFAADDTKGFIELLQYCKDNNIKYSKIKESVDELKHISPMDTSSELTSLKFIPQGRNIILPGNPGTGKTHISIGLGIKACQSSYKVLFTTVPRLITQIKECCSGKTLRQFENRFEKYDLFSRVAKESQRFH